MNDCDRFAARLTAGRGVWHLFVPAYMTDGLQDGWRVECGVVDLWMVHTPTYLADVEADWEQAAGIAPACARCRALEPEFAKAATAALRKRLEAKCAQERDEARIVDLPAGTPWAVPRRIYAIVCVQWLDDSLFGECACPKLARTLAEARKVRTLANQEQDCCEGRHRIVRLRTEEVI